MDVSFHEDSFIHSDNMDAYDDEREHPGEMLEQHLADIPRREALIVGPKTAVARVIERMNALSVGCALVVDRDALVGIFTERDVLKKLAARGIDPYQVEVSDLMTADPDTLPESATVAFALNRMVVEGYRHIPILDDDGKPVGVVAMRDIIHWMVELYPNKVLNVPPVPSSFPRTPEGA
jgi:CBS domain-containing protein